MQPCPSSCRQLLTNFQAIRCVKPLLYVQRRSAAVRVLVVGRPTAEGRG